MYTLEYPDPGTVVTWSLRPGGGADRTVHEFHPTVYVGAPDHPLARAAELLDDHPRVESLRRTERRPGWRDEYEPVLEVAATGLDGLQELARTVARQGRPGKYRLYDVDFSRAFRFCLATDTDPTPARRPSVLRLSAPETAYTPDGRLESATVEWMADGTTAGSGAAAGGETVTGRPPDVAAGVAARVAERDPDVLWVDTVALVPTLFEASDADDYRLGREPGYTKRAGRSTFESYGRVGHSPARYAVPGRAIVGESNCFWTGEAGFEGLLDLVERSGKPLQETAWASIGNVLTAIQVRHARERDVLVPWRCWRHERFKPAATLDAADRGGFTFAPDVGVHEAVHELDFASLYPNVIRTRNVSPETVRCDCHTDREDVPGLGYAICPDPGYLPDVLAPIVEDRERYKAELADATDPERRERLQARADALKWILVACFGYQGFDNAKFGRVECHEAINAFAREILLDAKATFESNGWRVVHGIVDSLWVQARADDPTPLADVAATITDEAGIRLEHEATYDWLAFCPRRDGDAGALTRYFGHEAGEPTDDEAAYKCRGIERRQRSTPPFLSAVQFDLLRRLGETRDPEAVCERVAAAADRLAADRVSPEELAVRNRVTKPLERYRQSTRNVAALQRAADLGLERHPGQDVRYVVVDDDRRSRERVALLAEDPATYDAAFYRDQLVRVAESVLSPVGWGREEVRRYLADRTDATLAAFGE